MSGCPSKKRRYRDHLAAKLALAMMRGGEKRRERRAYRCPDCAGWHLTSSIRRGES